MEIPFMSVAEVVKSYKTIRPITSFGSRPFFLQELSAEDLTEFSFIHLEDSNRQEVDRNTISMVKEMNMLHKYTYHGFFQPTVSEVISQIPKELLKKVVAFEIIKQPGKDYDFKFYPKEFEAGFHVSMVRLYSTREG